ncbi:MAG: hypothetical protein N2111_00810 [Candidatus Sumerlaeaceae bacterium]|nr:hypothetical protein [Candidatus Sumerlaeaceae bacterium]
MLMLALIQLAAAGTAVWASVLALRRRGDSGVPGPLRLAILLTASISILAAMITVGSVIQEKTGVAMSLPSNAKARARQWLTQHAAQPPAPREVGRNIRIIADGIAFYEAHAASFPLDLRARMQEYARLPEQPKRLLTPSEENRYYQAAVGVIQAISAVANDNDAPDSMPAGKTP